MSHKIPGASPSKRAQYAFCGICHAWKHEAGFRLHSALGIIELVLLLWMKAPLLWVLLLVVSASAVLCFELVNTAIESSLDLLHPSKHKLAKIAKDCGAEAVFFMSLVSAAIVLTYMAELYFSHSLLN
jgi:diacylglycerol kinase (ATP)